MVSKKDKTLRERNFSSYLVLYKKMTLDQCCVHDYLSQGWNWLWENADAQTFWRVDLHVYYFFDLVIDGQHFV